MLKDIFTWTRRLAIVFTAAVAGVLAVAIGYRLITRDGPATESGVTNDLWPPVPTNPHRAG